MDYVHIYDAERDEWEEGPPLEEDISGMAACALTLPRAILMEVERWDPEWQHDRLQNSLDVSSKLMSASDWEESDNLGDD